MKRIVQCVPNFSEGRDKTIIDEIVSPLKNIDGFKLIGYEPDKDYNRTVVTLLGDPDAMIQPLLTFFKKAQQLIDMRKHKGEHARMGAIDVVPFIPINGVTIDECIDYANRLATQVNEQFDIPVFMYAKAAKMDNREMLPTIRQGEFEGMEEKMQNQEWYPDYGKNHIHPSFGVVAIGARMPLIAYNIDLNTKDEKIANTIAKAIRKSSGGFGFVQAGPVYLDQREHVQVSMNILDYKKNPLYRVLETVKMEAKRFQVEVTSSEVIGLIPQDALVQSLKYYLACDNKVLEKTATITDVTQYAIKHLGLRDFDDKKIIEAHI